MEQIVDIFGKHFCACCSLIATTLPAVDTAMLRLALGQIQNRLVKYSTAKASGPSEVCV